MSEQTVIEGRPRRLLIVVSAVIGTTLLVGAIQGKLSRRWGMPAEVSVWGERLESLPGDVGPWQLSENSRLGSEVVDVLECVGHLKRTYVHRQTGESVDVAVTVGPAGPIAVHTPEVCYSAQNYQVERSRERVELPTADGRTDAFWAVTLDSKHSGEHPIRVYYAWTAGGPWQASERPRFQFSGKPCLYKIQLTCPAPTGSSTETGDACRRFLEAFVPALDRVLPSEEL